MCAIASSALLIGRTFRLALELDAVGHFALPGHSFGCAPQAKRGGRLACALIAALVPELASLPPDSGHSPLQLTRGGPAEIARRGYTLACKLPRRPTSTRPSASAQCFAICEEMRNAPALT